MQLKGDVPVPLQALVSGSSAVPREDGKGWFCQQWKGESGKGGLQMMKEQCIRTAGVIFGQQNMN